MQARTVCRRPESVEGVASGGALFYYARFEGSSNGSRTNLAFGHVGAFLTRILPPLAGTGQVQRWTVGRLATECSNHPSRLLPILISPPTSMLAPRAEMRALPHTHSQAHEHTTHPERAKWRWINQPEFKQAAKSEDRYDQYRALANAKQICLVFLGPQLNSDSFPPPSIIAVISAPFPPQYALYNPEMCSACTNFAPLVLLSQGKTRLLGDAVAAPGRAGI